MYIFQSSPTTTDAAINEIQQAATLDFNFIKNDLQDLQKSYFDSVTTNYLNSVKKLSMAANETYANEMPTNSSGYESSCLEAIIDDVLYNVEELNIAVAICANMSHSGQKIEENINQFNFIIKSLGNFSTNLTVLIDNCADEYPLPSWDRLLCAITQVEFIAKRFEPLFNQFKTYNEQMNGHLIVLEIEMSKCYKEALKRMDVISEYIQIDLEACKSKK